MTTKIYKSLKYQKFKFKNIGISLFEQSFRGELSKKNFFF